MKKIDSKALNGISDNIIIETTVGSEAERFAKEKGFKISYIKKIKSK